MGSQGSPGCRTLPLTRPHQLGGGAELIDDLASSLTSAALTSSGFRVANNFVCFFLLHLAKKRPAGVQGKVEQRPRGV